MEDVMIRDEQNPDVQYQVAKVIFDSFPDYKDKCLLIAEHMDLAAAIQIVNAREARRQAVEAQPDDTVPEEQVAVFRVYGQKDIALAEMLLKDNNINYRKD